MSVFGVFWSVFSLIRTEYGGIRSICGKIRTRKTSNSDTFHAVIFVYETRYSHHLRYQYDKLSRYYTGTLHPEKNHILTCEKWRVRVYGKF